MFEQPVQCINNLNSRINLNGGPCDNESDTRQRSDRRGPAPVGESRLGASCRRYGGRDLYSAGAADYVAKNRRCTSTTRPYICALRNPDTPVFHKIRLPSHDPHGNPPSGAPDQCHQRCRPVRGAGICRTTTPPFGSTGSPSIHYEIGAQAICESNDRTECRSIRTTRTHSGTDKLTIGNSAHITNQCGGLLNTAAQPLFHNLTHLKKENN